MLTNRELEMVRRDLVIQLASMRRQIGDELTVVADGHYGDMPGDAANTAGADKAIVHSVEEARDIEAALARIAGGSYGHCGDCGADIEAARLIAYPTSTSCEGCQAVRQKTFRRAQSVVSPAGRSG